MKTGVILGNWQDLQQKIVLAFVLLSLKQAVLSGTFGVGLVNKIKTTGLYTDIKICFFFVVLFWLVGLFVQVTSSRAKD